MTLDTDGFKIFRNILSIEEQAFLTNCIRSDTVNYTHIDEFIRNAMLGKIQIQIER